MNSEFTYASRVGKDRCAAVSHVGHAIALARKRKRAPYPKEPHCISLGSSGLIVQERCSINADTLEPVPEKSPSWVFSSGFREKSKRAFFACARGQRAFRHPQDTPRPSICGHDALHVFLRGAWRRPKARTRSPIHDWKPTGELPFKNDHCFPKTGTGESGAG